MGRGSAEQEGKGMADANAYLKEGVPVNVVNNILDCILFVNFGSQQLGRHRPVLLCLPVHLSHGRK